MATVTITWKNGNTTSFETSDPKTIARYESYEDDPLIEEVDVQQWP